MPVAPLPGCPAASTPNLPALTERVLAEGAPSTRTRYDAGVGIALASLLLSAVQLGWQVYRDLKRFTTGRSESRLQTFHFRLRLVYGEKAFGND